MVHCNVFRVNVEVLASRAKLDILANLALMVSRVAKGIQVQKERRDTLEPEEKQGNLEDQEKMGTLERLAHQDLRGTLDTGLWMASLVLEARQANLVMMPTTVHAQREELLVAIPLQRHGQAATLPLSPGDTDQALPQGATLHQNRKQEDTLDADLLQGVIVLQNDPTATVLLLCGLALPIGAMVEPQCCPTESG